jgi:hypothetical protein
MTANNFCPICFGSVRYDPCYPLAVCQNCYNLATDDRGRKLMFYNASLSGEKRRSLPILKKGTIAIFVIYTILNVAAKKLSLVVL